MLRMSGFLIRVRLWMTIVVIGGLVGSEATFAADVDLAKATPSGAVFFAEISGLEPWIEKLQNSPIVASLPSNPQVQAFYQSPQGKKADAGRKLIETQLGMDLWTLAKTLFGNRMAVALYPHDGRKEPDAVIIVQTKEAASLNRIRERLDPLLVLIGDQTQASQGPAGSALSNYDGKVFVADKDNWVVLASTQDLMTSTVSLLAGVASETKKSLSQDAAFVTMTQQMGDQHLVRSFLNLELIAKAKGGRLGPEKLDNPLASLIGGGLFELVNHSPFFGSTLDLNNERLLLTNAVAGKPESLGEKYQPLFAASDKSDAARLPTVPNLIGGFTLHRDFSGWYKRREELLQAKVLPEFDKFETGLGNLLPSHDFGTDILPTFGRNLTFLAAPQDYSHLQGKPGMQLPGLALIFDLAKPDEATEILNLFFQTISTITNLNAGQQGRQPWVLSSESYKDVQITYGKYGQKPKGDRLPVIFNFMPAAARVGDRFVMTSSVDLCKRLVDVYSTPATTTATHKLTRDDFLFELTGESLANILEVNRGLLEARSVAQEGKTSEQAQTDTTTLLQLVRAIRTLRMTNGAEGAGYQIQLEARWK
ncbi:MAG: hypothetical protein NT013_05460 [Planctomycetia bacterium]|nr:hypothetical protein [Planctomycetia bacterium]